MKLTKRAQWILCAIFALSLVPASVRGWERTEEEELEEVTEFKPIAEEIVKEPFMKEDQYLLRWLRAHSFDFEATTQALITAMAWRDQNDLDDIIYEHFSDSVKREYPYVLDGTIDKMGRPILQLLVGHFNLRKTTIAAQEHVLIRYVTLMLEMVERFIYYARVVEKHGNQTQASLIADLQGYNLMSTGCLKCLSIIPDMVPILESYYPGMFHRIYFINTPRIFDTMLKIIKNLMRADTRESLVLYDSEKTIWSAALLEVITAEQLPRKYGGTLQHPKPSLQAKLANYIEMERAGKLESIMVNTTQHGHEEPSDLGGGPEQDPQHPNGDHHQKPAHNDHNAHQVEVGVHHQDEIDDFIEIPDLVFHEHETTTENHGNHEPHHHYHDTQNESKPLHNVRNDLPETATDTEKGHVDAHIGDNEPLTATEKEPPTHKPTNKHSIDRSQFNWTKPFYKDVRKKPTLVPKHASGARSNFSYLFLTALIGLGAILVSQLMFN